MTTFKRILTVLAVLFAAAVVRGAEPLKVGDKAPSFVGKDQDGKEISSKELWGHEKVVLLYFYPKDNTPGCTKEACGLRDRMSDLKKDGVEVIGVSFDSSASHQKFIADQSLNFPLVADTDGKIADTYGVRMTGKNMARRVSFLIGKNGKIVHITDNPKADVHLAEMKEAIDGLSKK